MDARTYQIFSIVKADISRVGVANEKDIMFNMRPLRSKSGISKHQMYFSVYCINDRPF